MAPAHRLSAAFWLHATMSALGQKQTCAAHKPMSALSANSGHIAVPAEASSIQSLAMISHDVEKRSCLTIEKLDIRRKSATG